MSRLSSTARACVALGTVLFIGLLPVHAAAGEQSEVPEPSRPVHVWVPEPLPDAVEYPTLDLEARVLDLVLISEALDGTSHTEASNDALHVRLASNVLFGKDSAVLLPQSRERLAKIVTQLLDRGPGEIAITGYTDDLGSATHGYELSRQRAEAVRKIFAPRLDGYRLTTVGKGEEDPRVPNTNEKNRALNRRVEIHYTATQG